jgi:hypothetical protein
MRHIDVSARPVTRASIETQIELLIELLDRLDGDTDLESVGLEDDFEIPRWQLLAAAAGPGCLISDSDTGLDDGHEDDPLDHDEFDPTRPEGIPFDRPIYGIDQTAGILNDAKAHQAWDKKYRQRFG